MNALKNATLASTSNIRLPTLNLRNPMAQIIEISHNVILYDLLPSLQDILYVVVLCTSIFLVGILIFQHREKTIIDDL